MSLDKIIYQKGAKRFGTKEKMYQNSFVKNQNGSLPRTLVFSQVF